jgi:hypothetical protein
MSVKFKIGFTIAGETLFAMVAKMLPIEDLSVEELAPKPTLAERAIAVPKITHRAKPKTYQRPSPGPDLKRGVNAILMTEMSFGPKRSVELQPKVKAAGFSPNSVNSRLEALQRFGVIERIGDGRWRIKANAAA